MQEWEAEAQARVARARAAVEQAEAAAEAHAARAAEAQAARAAEAQAACAAAEHTHTTAAIQAPLSEVQSPEVLSSLARVREMLMRADELLLQLANARVDLNDEAAEELHGRVIPAAQEAEVHANGLRRFIIRLGVPEGAME